MHISAGSLRYMDYQIILFGLMVHGAMHGASDSVPTKTSVTFHVEYGKEKGSFRFDKVRMHTKALFNFDNEVVLPAEHTIRIHAPTDKKADFAFEAAQRGEIFSLCTIYARSGKAAEISVAVGKKFRPLAERYFERNDRKSIEHLHWELKAIRESQCSSDLIPSTFSVAWIIGLKAKKKYFSIVSGYDERTSDMRTFAKEVTVFKNDNFTFDFTKNSEEGLRIQNEDPLVEHLRKNLAYRSYIRLYGEDPASYPTDKRGEGILHVAALLHDTKTIELALTLPIFREHINDRSKDGRNVLDYALLFGYADIVNLLIANGAH